MLALHCGTDRQTDHPEGDEFHPCSSLSLRSGLTLPVLQSDLEFLPAPVHFGRCCSWLKDVRQASSHTQCFQPSMLAKVLPPPSPPHFFLPFLPSPQHSEADRHHPFNPGKQQAWSPCIPCLLAPATSCYIHLFHHLPCVFILVFPSSSIAG